MTPQHIVQVVLDAAECFDDACTCTCGADDPKQCWYHLSSERQRDVKVAFIADCLEEMMKSEAEADA